jgi:hypothetical protein
MHADFDLAVFSTNFVALSNEIQDSCCGKINYQSIKPTNMSDSVSAIPRSSEIKI